MSTGNRINTLLFTSEGGAVRLEEVIDAKARILPYLRPLWRFPTLHKGVTDSLWLESLQRIPHFFDLGIAFGRNDSSHRYSNL